MHMKSIILDSKKVRDDEVAVVSAGPYVNRLICTSLQFKLGNSDAI